MRATRKKRAHSARRRRAALPAFLVTLPLVLGAWAIRETCELGAHCTGVAKVSIERNGLNGTDAGAEQRLG